MATGDHRIPPRPGPASVTFTGAGEDDFHDTLFAFVPGGEDRFFSSDVSVAADKSHSVDLAIARAVRMEPRAAVEEAINAAEPARPALTPRHIPGLRAEFYESCFVQSLDCQPAIARYEAAHEAGQDHTITDDDWYAVLDFHELVVTMAALQEAQPFFMPAAYGQMVCESDPPDAEFLDGIRLPYSQCLLWFARPVVFSDDTEDQGRLAAGVLLAADASTQLGLLDNAIWLLLEPDQPRSRRHWRDALDEPHPDSARRCHTSLSDWKKAAAAGQLANAAAALAALPFREPPASPPDVEPLTAPWRKELKRSATRRAIEAGAITGIRVLDLGRLPDHQDADEQDYLRSTELQMRPHWRRGHWRPYRVATRNEDGEIIGDRSGTQGIDWQYQPRWIPPKRINAHLDPVEPPAHARIYHIPEPHEGQPR